MTYHVLHTKTNEEWAAQVIEYRKTGSEILLVELINELKQVAIPIGRRAYYNYKQLGVSIQEFEYEAEYAIYKAIEVYDPEKGSLPALLKQLAVWGISDHIVRPANTQKGRFNNTAYRIDMLENDAEPTDPLIASGLTITEESVYGGIIEPEKERTFVTILEELIEEFSGICSKDDSNIIKTVFDVALVADKFSAKDVNKSLTTIFPDIKMPTIRKKKQRALDRFTDFAKEKGYKAIDMSQF